jgi:arsenate reductase
MEKLQVEDRSFELQDIKKDPIQEAQLQFLAQKLGGYDQLLNKRARKYRELDLKNRVLTESELKSLILSAYTLLKRPVFVIDDLVYAGNSKKTIEKVEKTLYDSE